LADRFSAETDLVRLENPDDLAECYRQISTKITELRQADPPITLLASYELASDQKRQIRQLQDICAGFDAWDRFGHNPAWSLH
jgi:hypothetical protein